MAIAPRELSHFDLPGNGDGEPFTSPRRPDNGLPPPRIRATHAGQLLQAAVAAVASGRARIRQRDPQIAAGEPGFYLEFAIPVAHATAIDALENKPKHIELVAVRPLSPGDESAHATVFVPEASAEFFTKKIEQYRDENTRGGQPKNNALIARVDDVRSVASRALFTDLTELFPAPGVAAWWEVWARDGKLANVLTVAGRLGLAVQEERVRFPERDVVLIRGTSDQIEALVVNCDGVAELRAAKDTPSFFLDMGAVEQADWAGNLANRSLPPPQHAPAICILDSGVTREHPLIAPALEAVDQHAYVAAWGGGDSAYWGGHGTQMAGSALYGCLFQVLPGGGQLQLAHRLESVKILPNNAHNDPYLYGKIIEDAVDAVESLSPLRPRVFCMSVTSSVGLARGRPTSWSAAIDQLAYGQGANSRLFILAAGNIRDDILPAEYPDRNDLAECESPTQAWNALVVGACTDKIALLDPNYAGWQPLAPAGDLSPTSRTSTIWDRQWPVRPDVVFEGGNMAHDNVNTADAADDLQLVTTHFRPNNRMFDSFGDTSAATAQVSRMAAQILVDDPARRPETVRGLIVHSAEWTSQMRNRLQAAATPAERRSLFRRYGWGVPSLERALKSAKNDATLIVEDVLLPLKRVRSVTSSRNMNLHELPWPKARLTELAHQPVEMRVTLSYFVEPNPGERGWGMKHRYTSHALRFAVKHELETPQQFRARINRAAADDEDAETPIQGLADQWVWGPHLRDKGSLHSDVWRGTGAQLAERGFVAVYPVGGWWKSNTTLRRWDRAAPYSLIVTLRAPDIDVDLHAEITNALGVGIGIA